MSGQECYYVCADDGGVICISVMDKQRALKFAEQQLRDMSSRSYSELSALIDTSESKMLELDNDNYFQTQIQIFWDDPKEKKDIRVSCSIDGCGISAYAPLSADFIITPEETFIE